MIENLAAKNMKELRSVAKELGLPGGKGESAEALRMRITLHLQPQLLDQMNKNGTEQGVKAKPVATAEKPIVWVDPQEVVEALRPFQDRLKLAFYDENGNPSTARARTWHVKNGPAEDSGSLSMSLHWIKVKATEVANARFPAKISRTGTDMDGALGV